MSTPVVSAPRHLQGAGTFGTAAIGRAPRVRAQSGPLVTLLDQLVFPNGTGRMVVGSSRVRVSGVPILPSNAQGQHVTPGGTTSNLLIVQGDARVRAR